LSDPLELPLGALFRRVKRFEFKLRRVKRFEFKLQEFVELIQISSGCTCPPCYLHKFNEELLHHTIIP
jgi:hypothetical protein